MLGFPGIAGFQDHSSDCARCLSVRKPESGWFSTIQKVVMVATGDPEAEGIGHHLLVGCIHMYIPPPFRVEPSLKKASYKF